MKTKICVLGDSISWGANDYEFCGWCNRIQKDFKDFEKRIYNSSISGANTNHLLERADVEIRARTPDVVVYAIGINDSQKINNIKSAVDLEPFADNLKKLYKIAKKFTDKIIFIGLTRVDESRTNPCFWNESKFYSNIQIKGYNRLIEYFCLNKSLIFIDILDLLTNKDLDDGLHPNAKGHKKLAKKIKPVLMEFLE